MIELCRDPHPPASRGASLSPAAHLLGLFRPNSHSLTHSPSCSRTGGSYLEHRGVEGRRVGLGPPQSVRVATKALKFPPTLVARLHRLHHQRLGRCKDTIDCRKRWTVHQEDKLPRPFITHEDSIDERASEQIPRLFTPTPHHHPAWRRYYAPLPLRIASRCTSLLVCDDHNHLPHRWHVSTRQRYHQAREAQPQAHHMPSIPNT